MLHKIKALYDEGNGYPIKQIAEELSISRNTVRKYLRMSEEEFTEYMKNRQREKVLDTYKDYIVHLLQKYPKLTSVKIKRKLESKKQNLSLSDRTLRRYVKQLKKEIFLKQERYYEPVIDMIPGIQCQVDMGELRDVMIGGIPTTVYFTVFVLSYSRFMYVSASDKPINTKTFITMHDEAFTYFNGLVDECVYDQTKLVVIKEEFREVWFNEAFYRYATVARFDIRVCEGYDPQSKGKVESGVKYVKNDFFYAEEFMSFKELKESLLSWIEKTANVRIHGTTKERPEDVYEVREKEAMKHYLRPSFIIEDNSGATREVDKTSLISYKSNKYSVPMKYQSSTVRITEEESKLVIYGIDTKDVIAAHDIYEGKGAIVKNKNHYRDHQKLVSDRENEIGEAIGKELSERLCSIIKATSPKIYKDQLVGFIQLLGHYADKEDLNEALNTLSQRSRLTVTFMMDYLAAFYSHRESQVKDSAPDQKTGELASYGLLSMQTFKERTYGQL